MSKKSVATTDGTPIVESKANKFRRLTNLRLGKLERIAKQVASLANAKTYEYTDAQKGVILSVADSAFRLIENSFANGSVAKSDMEVYV